MIELPLILGGHTYIQQLGNEPRPSSAQIDAIVSACLDAGIHWFDTTYRPERIALGESLQRLRRRDEAHMVVWNFFTLFGDGEDVGGPEAYQPHHIDAMLRELHTDHIDALVVHAVAPSDDNARQTELAVMWQHQGRVGTLGCWSPGIEAAQQAAQIADRTFSFVVEPHNVTTRDSLARIRAYAQAGWSVYACSPFVRGWEVDRLVERAGSTREQGETSSALRSRISDLLIRYSLFTPSVERLIIAMRRPEWVHAAAEAVQRGPLTQDERAWLNSLTTP